MSSEQPGFGYGRPQHGGPQYGGPQYEAPQYEAPLYEAPQPGPLRPGTVQPQASYPPGTPAPEANRRPVSVTLSCVLTVTASLQGVGAVAMIWLFIAAGVGTLDATDSLEGPIFHILERANLALTNGLAAPLLGFPAAGFIVGFLVLIRANWARILSTALGIGAGAWLVIWKLNQLDLVAVPIAYIAISVLLLWLPGNNPWYRGRVRTGP